MQVRKRNGKVVPFDDGYINRAITLAAIAAGEFGKVGCSRNSIRNQGHSEPE